MARFDRMTPQGPAGFAGNIAPAAMRTGGGQGPQAVAPGPHPIVSNPALSTGGGYPRSGVPTNGAPIGGVLAQPGGLPPTRQPVPLGHVGPTNAVGMYGGTGGVRHTFTGTGGGVPPWFASMYGAARR